MRCLRAVSVLLALSACSGSGGHQANGGMAGSGGRAGGAGPIDVDVLFMIDNTIHMPNSQKRLLESFPAFTQALAALPGGMPNLHLAVISSDMGAGTRTDGCFGNGQNGSFQITPQQTVSGALCETTLQNGARFLSNVDGVTNYTGDLVDVFSCIAPLGESGCSFEQPLLSVMHALGADNIVHGVPQPPADNAGFLRPDAYLVIVLLTNEDDCSAPGGSANDLFPRVNEAQSVTATYGAPNSYRCNRYGHLCGEPKAPPPSEAPAPNATVTLTDCVPAEGVGNLIPVAEIEAAIKALKREPSQQIVVAAITGVYPAPSAAYVVEWAPSPPNIPSETWPRLQHQCRVPDTSGADPAVRLSDWVRRFGENGILRSICDADMAPALQQVVDRLAAMTVPN